MDDDKYDFQALVFAQAQRAAQIIERACERSLLEGHGVRVTLYSDGGVSAAVDPEVPYGYIHEVRV